MKIDDIETADCRIENMSIGNSEIKIIFESVYNIKNKNFIENVSIVINNWGKMVCREYIQKSPFKKGYWKQNNQINHFEIIQEIERENEKITLRGFCKKTGYWMEYRIENYKIEIIN